MFSFQAVIQTEQYRWASDSPSIVLGTKGELKYKAYRLYKLIEQQRKPAGSPELLFPQVKPSE